MALFDPPLYKPGNMKCPNCGHPEGWRYFWGRGRVFRWLGLWREWRCSKCQSVLLYDSRRRWVWVVPWLTVIIGWNVIVVMTEPSWPVLLIEAFVLFAIVCLAWQWFESFKLIKTTTEKLCDNCGCRLKPGFDTCKWCGAEVK